MDAAIVFLGVVVATFATFLPALGADFVSWDDNRNFLGNPSYRGLGTDQLRWMWTTTLMGHYVPLTWMSLGLDYVLWGMNPAGYHATSLALHSVNAGLLFWLGRRLYLLAGESASAAAFPAAVAALAFSLHPLRTESVAWVTERRDVLSMMFYLASLLAYLRAAGGGPDRRAYIASIALFVCALLSKATAVTLPIVLLILNVYPLRRWQEKRSAVFREVLPFMGIAAATGLLSLFVLHPPNQLSLIQKLGVSAYSFGFYLQKTLLPLSLSPLYPLPRTPNLLGAPFLLAYVVCIAYALVAWRMWSSHRGVAVAMMAFVAIILPLLGIVQNGPQIAADRYTYNAAPALSLLAGAALLRWRHVGLRLTAVAVLVVWAALTWNQTRVWKDSASLWSRVLAVDSSSSVALFGLGDVRIAQNRRAEALDLYRRAVQVDSEYAEGRNNLGILLAQEGDDLSAIAEFRRAIGLQPRLAEAHANLGAALARVGDDSSAVAEFAKALSIRADLVDAEINWGNVLVRQGKPRLAVPHYTRAISLDARNARAHLNLGVALAQSAEFHEAARHFQAALSLDPALTEAREYLRAAQEQIDRRPPP